MPKTWLTYDFGHFTTISGHFFTSYIYIFHKTEVQTVILKCWTSLNLIWIKSYDIKHNFFWQLCFSILEEKTENLRISFKKLRFRRSSWVWVVCKNLSWIKSFNKILDKIFIFSCLRMHYFKGILPKWVLTPLKETSSRIFKMTTFLKFFLASMRDIIR